MEQWLAEHPWVVWIGVAALLAVAEMLSLDLVLLMFALGALTASVGAGIGIPLWLCVLVFAVVSGLLLFTVRRPLMHQLHDGPTLHTGYTGLIGRTVEVVQPVDQSTGRVVADGDMWTARTDMDTSIAAGEYVVIRRIEGATLLVDPQDD